MNESLEQASIPQAIIRWPLGLRQPAEVFPQGGTDEVDKAIFKKLSPLCRQQKTPTRRRGRMKKAA